jgi:hypothetical protein
MAQIAAYARAFALALAVLPATASLWAVTVSPGEQTIRVAQGGPFPKSAQIVVENGAAWTAAVSPTDGIALQPNTGTGRTTVTIAPAGWWLARAAPGKHEVRVTIGAGDSRATAKVTYEVVERRNPRFESAWEPKGCVDVPNLAPGNKAACTVPDLRPPGNFLPPMTGQSYRDPNFGTAVRILADFPSLHGYSTPSPISANNRYALISRASQPTLVSLADGKLGKSVPVPIEGTIFDSNDDDILYAISDGAIKSYHIGTRKWKTLTDYTRKPFSFSAISFGGTGEISKDNWISFFAPQERRVCALDTATVQTYCGQVPGSGNIDYTTMSKGVDSTSGRRYVVLIGPRPFLVYAVNPQTKSLDLVQQGPENLLLSSTGNLDGVCDPGETCIGGGHSDTYEDAAGNQYLAAALESQAPCEYSIYTLRLNAGAKMGLPAEVGGGLTRILPLFRCGNTDRWVDYHMGCAKKAPYCVVSTTNGGFNQTRQATDRTAPTPSPYMGEVFLFGDNGAFVRRLFYHRSFSFATEEGQGYWSTPRAAIAPDGSLVIADSNFGTPNQQRVILAETGIKASR